jgi:phosphoglycolate phosphatase-like HAD superfamily hydrolase
LTYKSPVLFWDIDGTLLTTGRAGIFAWEEAVLEETGIVCDLTDFHTAGKTDHEIGALILRHLGVAGAFDPDRLVRCYESRVGESLHRRRGSVLSGAVSLLDAVEQMERVCQFLLTGNTRLGAQAKLSHYGLHRYFPNGGGFSDDAPDRPGIARAALRHAAELVGAPLAPVVIGDTPADIHCGHAIGARVLAVATGGYSIQELEAHRPWWTTARLPAPDEFTDRLASVGG